MDNTDRLCSSVHAPPGVVRRPECGGPMRHVEGQRYFCARCGGHLIGVTPEPGRHWEIRDGWLAVADAPDLEDRPDAEAMDALDELEDAAAGFVAALQEVAGHGAGDRAYWAKCVTRIGYVAEQAARALQTPLEAVLADEGDELRGLRAGSLGQVRQQLKQAAEVAYGASTMLGLNAAGQAARKTS